MLEKLSERFTEKLVSLGIVQKEDAEIYSFGFFQLFMMLINVVTTIFLGVVFRQFWQCLLLNASYIPIRMCAGGHHASSPVKCYWRFDFDFKCGDCDFIARRNRK